MIKIKSPKGIDCLSLIQRANSNKIFHHKEASARLALEEKVILWISNHESVNLNKSGYAFAKLLGSNQKEGKTKSLLIIQLIEMAPHGKLNQIAHSLAWEERTQSCKNPFRGISLQNSTEELQWQMWYPFGYLQPVASSIADTYLWELPKLHPQLSCTVQLNRDTFCLLKLKVHLAFGFLIIRYFQITYWEHYRNKTFCD